MTNYTNLIDKVNIPELVKALRECASDDPDCIYNCPYYNHDVCADDLKSDAAAAIEELEKERDYYKQQYENRQRLIKCALGEE